MLVQLVEALVDVDLGARRLNIIQRGRKLFVLVTDDHRQRINTRLLEVAHMALE